MAHAGPDVYWKWLELHDSVSLGSVERKVRTASGTRQWRIHRRPKPKHSLLDERRLHYAAWDGCLDQVKAMLEHGVPANCQLVIYNLKGTDHPKNCYYFHVVLNMSYDAIFHVNYILHHIGGHITHF